MCDVKRTASGRAFFWQTAKFTIVRRRKKFSKWKVDRGRLDVGEITCNSSLGEQNIILGVVASEG